MPTDKYVAVIRVIMGVVSFVFVVVLVFVYPYTISLTESESLGETGFLFFLISLGSIYTLIFSVMLTSYEHFFWKLHSRKNDYSGFWKMVIRYEFLERDNTNRSRVPLPYIFESVFKIEQSIFELRFSEGFSAENEIWRDQSLRLVENGIKMSYKVHRTDKSLTDPIPSEMIGYEEVDVLERDNLGRPKYMTGRMYHACIPNTALYRGSTTYERVSKKEYQSLLRKMRDGSHKTEYGVEA